LGNLQAKSLNEKRGEEAEETGTGTDRVAEEQQTQK
jgi:hypothetical protein